MPETGSATPNARPPQCATCGKVSTTPYCSECGERKLPGHPLSVWHFISHHLVHEFTHLDGRIAKTL
ncbi:MAG TPA: hypothetical protein VJ723_13145 [Candidatus Angelobacter sp.]|nr:hypothetical protein [Candidatus Angelobacter sp.]